MADLQRIAVVIDADNTQLSKIDDVLREIRQANAEAAATKVRRGLWKKRR